jgi:hypothetical protein
LLVSAFIKRLLYKCYHEINPNSAPPSRRESDRDGDGGNDDGLPGGEKSDDVDVMQSLGEAMWGLNSSLPSLSLRIWLFISLCL